MSHTPRKPQIEKQIAALEFLCESRKVHIFLNFCSLGFISSPRLVLENNSASGRSGFSFVFSLGMLYHNSLMPFPYILVVPCTHYIVSYIHVCFLPSRCCLFSQFCERGLDLKEMSYLLYEKAIIIVITFLFCRRTRFDSAGISAQLLGPGTVISVRPPSTRQEGERGR